MNSKDAFASELASLVDKHLRTTLPELCEERDNMLPAALVIVATEMAVLRWARVHLGDSLRTPSDASDIFQHLAPFINVTLQRMDVR